MKQILSYLMPMLILSLAGPALGEDGMNEIGDAFVKAFKAGDLDGVAALYSEDAVSYAPDTMVARGREEIRKSWGGLLNNFTVKDLIISDAHHETRGDFSAAWGQFKMVLVPKQGGDTVIMEGRFADAAKLVDGKWQYIMDHASMPLPPAPEEVEAP